MDKAMDLVCANLCCRISWHLKRIRMIAAMYISSITILRNCETELQSPHKNLAWWTVTRRTLQNCRTVKTACSEMGACLGQYCKLCMKPVGQSETTSSCTAVNSSQGKHSWLQWCREKFFSRGAKSWLWLRVTTTFFWKQQDSSVTNGHTQAN